MTTSLTQRTRVLVVDDEPSICRALSIALDRAGYAVNAVQSGEAAHALLTTERYDGLVLDLRIPDVRGDVLFELAVSLQPHLRHATVFTTGDAGERASALIAACNCPTILKPFDLPDLLAIVARLTQRRGRGMQDVG